MTLQIAYTGRCLLSFPAIAIDKDPKTMEPAKLNRVGVYLALLQLFFTLTWTVYVIFLPALAAQVGIRPQAVILILMLDQAIFAVMDYLMGQMADRVSKIVGRLSKIVAKTTAVSCIAFLLLPFVAPTGNEALFIAITILWSASSSVLRAPPLALLGKYAARGAVPWLASLSMFGLGMAGAVSPYLTVALREIDPRVPFALASIALLIVTLGLGWAERNLANAPAQATPEPVVTVPTNGSLGVFLVAVALLGFGFQIHFSLNAAPTFLKFAKPPDLDHLMPIFWIGFNVLMLPGTMLTSRYGGLKVMAAGGVIGAIAAFFVAQATSVAALGAAQFVAGGAWGIVMMSTVTSALAIGQNVRDGGREGSITGVLFSLLAITALARMMIVWTELNKAPSFASIQLWLPVAAWLLASGALLLIVRKKPAKGMSAAM